MADYSISFSRSARKELEVLPASLVQRIFSKIELLTVSPRAAGCRKLKGYDDLWRIRIGDYRVIYSIVDDQLFIDIIAVRHRSQAYD
jgi:mRNA interferase RelE/StbE